MKYPEYAINIVVPTYIFSVAPQGGIRNFLAQIDRQGGMSTSNNYVVEVAEYPAARGDLPFSPAGLNDSFYFFCDEAQLPNVNTATGTQNGVIHGIGSVDYPHTRVFTEVQLTFMLDANLTILKFLNNWHGLIFSDFVSYDDEYRPRTNRATKLSYRTEYAAKLVISKAEAGPLAETQRRPVTYVLENAYPYSIDAIPLQYGSSQITRVTANFKYERHYIIGRDIRNTPQSVSMLPDTGVGTAPPNEVRRGPDGNIYTWPPLTPPPPVPPT